ncbi:hypothetical protein GCM10008107_09880 [Psychrosphaera saromensis]|uniref:Ion-translocating oxidoreductase complex subunit G n=1 Tax=Psychrosphaera saromensis TaxID=716813 RepID=A0A2S7UVG4_9GAMM|nr:electron transport complex subunit RsxG [Psychrosphaera saromensis]PQJ53728.1 electron transport complex subunit RsxG [Psychrosphaera saromensis]GHB62802.1 hypothetical protein GCM10008107_09880 [Psychrosphaera saromensis]GLQ15491.1 hypothetical protein GCM10007917_29460 [Psychrosphaera saromensis]
MSKNLLIFTSKKNALLLSAFAAVCTLLVSITYVLTAPVIEKQAQQDLLNKLNQVLVPTKFDNNPLENCFRLTDYNIFGDEQQHVIYRATMQDKPYALVFQTQTLKGYNGLIKMMVAVDQKGKVQGVRALKHQETPGLGDKIDLEKSDWVLSFNNMNVTSEQDKNWFVKKDSGYVDQFTGATITPRAVVNQLRHSILYVTLNFNSLFTQENQCEPAPIPVEPVNEPEILIEPEIETQDSALIPEEAASEQTTPEEATTEAKEAENTAPEIVTPEAVTDTPVTNSGETESKTESKTEGTTPENTSTEATKPEIEGATATEVTTPENTGADSKAEDAETDVAKPDAVKAEAESSNTENKPESTSDTAKPADTKPKAATEDAKDEDKAAKVEIAKPEVEAAKPKAEDSSTDEAKPAKAEADKVETKDEEPVTKPAESSDETPSASSDKASDKESDEDSEKDAVDESETPKKEVPND